MCGIVGFWSARPVPLEDLATCTDLLAHRGPDGFGCLTADDGRLGLGHRRLAILDPGEGARQPMVSDDGRYALVFNGEIYNFIEIRDELQARDHRFRTESDTEVLLHAYMEWGPACQHRFNGMWAFAIWDDLDRLLFLSRDRFGVKPLRILCSPWGTAFASEQKAFHALPWPLEESADGISRSVDGAAVPVLRGGMQAIVRAPSAQPEVSRWWRPRELVEPADSTYPEQVERFRAAFLDATRLRMRSDVPVATAVSGGLDSSSVLAAVHSLRGEVERRPEDWARAFTVVARGTAHDELDFAAAACRAVGIQPTIVDLFARVRVDELDEYLYLTEGMPLTNLSAFYLYRSMREGGVPVSLDGQGADEILGGYYWDVLRTVQAEGSWLRRPRRTLDLVRTAWGLTRNSPYVSVGWKSLLMQSSPAARGIVGRAPGLRRRLPATEPDHWDAETREMAEGLAPLHRLLFMAVGDDIQELLERYDLLSMSSGLEIRMPFLDWRLVVLTQSLPAESLVGHGFTKRILRDAVRPWLPQVVVDRRSKLQFQGPIRELLANELREWWQEEPSLRGVAPTVLESGTYAEVRDFGLDVVSARLRRTYSAGIRARVASIRARHRAGAEVLRRHTRVL